MPSPHFFDCSDRPTLPPLHTLNLPLLTPSKKTNLPSQELNEKLCPTSLHGSMHTRSIPAPLPLANRIPDLIRGPPSASSSRTPSPQTPPAHAPGFDPMVLAANGRDSLKNSPQVLAARYLSAHPHFASISKDANDVLNHNSTPTAQQRDPSFRLLPCPIETADAIVLVTPRSSSESLTSTCESNSASTELETLLLVGPALKRFRENHPRPLIRGARAHPYRIVASPRKGSIDAVSNTRRQTMDSKMVCPSNAILRSTKNGSAMGMGAR